MASLRRTKVETDESSAEVSPYDPPLYPVSMYISDDEVEKLGLENSKVGAEMLMTATVKVTSFSVDERMKDKKSYSITLTVMEAELKEKPASKTQAETLFGE
jgi:predicted transcriptional regulator